jgi:uncharacterized membrane protein
MAIASAALMFAQSNDFGIFKTFTATDWVLMCLWALFSVMYQTVKFMALQQEMPGKLAHYQYLSLIYQFIFDIFVSHTEFGMWQFIGIGILISGYALQSVDIIKKLRKKVVEPADAHNLKKTYLMATVMTDIFAHGYGVLDETIQEHNESTIREASMNAQLRS